MIPAGGRRLGCGPDERHLLFAQCFQLGERLLRAVFRIRHTAEGKADKAGGAVKNAIGGTADALKGKK